MHGFLCGGNAASACLGDHSVSKGLRGERGQGPGQKARCEKPSRQAVLSISRVHLSKQCRGLPQTIQKWVSPQITSPFSRNLTNLSYRSHPQVRPSTLIPLRATTQPVRFSYVFVWGKNGYCQSYALKVVDCHLTVLTTVIMLVAHKCIEITQQYIQNRCTPMGT